MEKAELTALIVKAQSGGQGAMAEVLRAAHTPVSDQCRMTVNQALAYWASRPSARERTSPLCCASAPGNEAEKFLKKFPNLIKPRGRVPCLYRTERPERAKKKRRKML